MDPWGYVAIAVVVVIIMLIAIVIILRSGRKQSDVIIVNAEPEAEQPATEEEEEPETEQSVPEEGKEPETEQPAPVKQEKAETKKSAPAKQNKANAATKAQSATKSNDKTVTGKKENKMDEQTKTTGAKPAASNKVYHISQRKDDMKWQVKAAGGEKALKLFNTQAEAIDYAKKVAGNQEARIVIHKVDGSFRKLTY